MTTNLTPVNTPANAVAIYGLENTTAADPSSSAFSYLTPDALLSYCETKLNSTDSQMESYFNNEQTDASEQQVMTQVEAQLNAVSGGFDTGKGQQGIQLINQLNQDIASLPPGSAAATQLASLRDDVADKMDPSGAFKAWLNSTDPSAVANASAQYFAANPGNHDADFITDVCGAKGGQVIDGPTAAGWSTTAQSISSSIGNDSQMGMIQLQSLMSDRQTAIQMCTNLVQSLADQTKSITSNIGH